MDTQFAPAERKDLDEVRAESDQLAPVIGPWLDAVPVCVVVLNRQRQIVFGNKPFWELANRACMDEVLGLRPGEALECLRATIAKGGCGCSSFCSQCGAAQAILCCLRGQGDCKECQIIRLRDQLETPLNLQVFTRPVRFCDKDYVLFTALDVSHEKRLQYMERRFYHEMINMAGGMTTLAPMLAAETVNDLQTRDLMHESARRVLQEVLYMRDVAAVEAGRAVSDPVRVSLAKMVDSVVADVSMKMGMAGVRVRAEGVSGDVRADGRLLRHILENLLSNAFEAPEASEPVVVSSAFERGFVNLSVSNRAEMPRGVRKRLFLRYVSSKGSDRGLGLYISRKIAVENLGGDLTHEEKDGRQVFTLRLPLEPPGAV